WVSGVDAEEFWFGAPEWITRLKELKEWEFLKLKEEVIEFVGGNDPSEPFRFVPKKIRVEDEAYDDFGPVFEPSPLSVSETLERWLTKENMAVPPFNAAPYLGEALAPPRTVPAVTRKPFSFVRRPGEQQQVEQPSPVPLRKEIKIVPTIDFGTPTVSFDLSTATWVIESDPKNLFFIRFG